MKVDRADIEERIRKAINAERTGHKMRPLRIPTGAQFARAAMTAIKPELDLLERVSARRPVLPTVMHDNIVDVIKESMNPNCDFCDSDPKQIAAKIMALLVPPAA